MIDDIWKFFHGGSEFAIKTGRSGTPGAEKSTFSKVARNELKIGAFYTEFYGEFESKVGFAKNPQKSSKISSLFPVSLSPMWGPPRLGGGDGG